MKEKTRTAKNEKQASREGLMRRMLPAGTQTHTGTHTHLQQSLKPLWCGLLCHDNNHGVNNIGKWQQRLLTFQVQADAESELERKCQKRFTADVRRRGLHSVSTNQCEYCRASSKMHQKGNNPVEDIRYLL